MKTAQVLKKIRQAAKDAGLEFSTKEGANHTKITVGAKTTTIGRHTETGDLMAQKIYKQLEGELGEGWWR